MDQTPTSRGIAPGDELTRPILSLPSTSRQDLWLPIGLGRVNMARWFPNVANVTEAKPWFHWVDG